jgi:hypothetical protein
MAVYEVKATKEITITLDDGQSVTLNVRHGAFSVEDMETLESMREDFPRHQKRMEFLQKKADAAVEGTDEEYEEANRRVKEFRKRIKIFDMVDETLGALVESTSDHLFLTKEDKEANRPVEFTREGLKANQNPRFTALKFELFSKLMAKLGAGDEKEKKEQSESLPSGSQSQNSESVQSQASTISISSPASTV